MVSKPLEPIENFKSIGVDRQVGLETIPSDGSTDMVSICSLPEMGWWIFLATCRPSFEFAFGVREHGVLSLSRKL